MARWSPRTPAKSRARASANPSRAYIRPSNDETPPRTPRVRKTQTHRRHDMTPSRRTFLGSGAALLALSATAGFAQPDDMTPEAIFHDPDGPALGNPDADLTIVEFFDYQCPFCKKGHPELMDVVKSDGNIRIVMKDWPI